MDIASDLPLVSTIAVGLSLAFVCGFAAAKLRMSPLIGYLLAGYIVGPHSPGYVADIHIAEELSEIGIVLLMFGVGLHFSVSDFWEVKKIALTGALIRIVLITAAGTGLAALWGWPTESGILFGLSLSVASTVVLLRALEERNLLQTMAGRISIGWLIVEDLAMIFALVLVPALANISHEPQAADGAVRQVVVAIGKVGLFAAIMLVVGKRFFPWLLEVVSRTGSRELFTLAVFAIAIGIAFGAAMFFDVSLALGAFFAGMMIRESDLNHEVAERVLPLQDAFAVLFFVSVGMLFNPAIIVSHPVNVLAAVGIIVVAKFLVTFLIVMLFGYPLKTGLIVSAGLAQIGEFSFVLITLGLSLGLLPADGRDLVLAGALISIALKPLMFSLSRLIYGYAERTPRISGLFNMRDDDLAHLRGDEKQALRDTIILVGHGQVGKHISDNINESRIDLVVIDRNREKISGLRKRGFLALAGDATHDSTLREAAIHKASAIVVGIPDPFEARQIVEIARALKPDIKVLVRAHNDEEANYFNKQNVDLTVSGTQEIGRRIVGYLNDIKAVDRGQFRRKTD